MEIEVRYRIEHRPYNLLQRVFIWWQGLKEAFLESPPKTYCDYIKVLPGEFGYEDAPYSFHSDQEAPRFELKDGAWQRVKNPTGFIQPNPAYYTPQ